MLKIPGAAHDFSLRVLAEPRTSTDESRVRRIKRSITSRPVLNVTEQWILLPSSPVHGTGKMCRVSSNICQGHVGNFTQAIAPQFHWPVMHTKVFVSST